MREQLKGFHVKNLIIRDMVNPLLVGTLPNKTNSRSAWKNIYTPEN